MAYIATDLDAFDSAQGVAGATGLPLQHVLGGLALLWRWCWRQKTDGVAVDQVAAHFGSTAPGLPSALVAFGFLAARADGSYRVRGAGRYLHITAVRAEAGKVRAKAPRDARGRLLKSSTSPAHAGDTASTPPASRQHATSPSATSDERRATSEGTDLPRAAPAPLLLDGVTDDPPTPKFGGPALLELWNARARSIGWPRWDAMTDKRRIAIGARLREHPDREWWERVVEEMTKSPFLRGENDRGWKPGPDWLLKPGSGESVLEGKYAGRAVSGGGRGIPADIRKGTARAEDSDHLHGPPGEHEF